MSLARSRMVWMAVLSCALSPLRAQTDDPSSTSNSANETNNAPAYFAPSTAPSPAPSQPVATPTTNPILQDNIRDIRPPYFYLRDWFWLWVTLATLAAIGLIVGLWYWLRPNPQLSAKTAYELALENLAKARSLLREDQAMAYAVAVSETIRSYLSQRFQSPSTRRTTEEFLRQMEANPTSHLAGHRELLRGFLQSCDLVKFARYQPSLAELEKVQESAFGFVNATKPADHASNGGISS